MRFPRIIPSALVGAACAMAVPAQGVELALIGVFPNKAVVQVAEIEECHMIAGRFDYLLKIRTRDIRRYRHVLGERISELPFVASTSTNVTMETVVDTWNARSRNA